MSRKVSTYVPSEVSCLILGLDVIGFDNDSFITITPMDERVTYRKTPHGAVTAFIHRNQVYEVEIKLKKTSPSNAFMQILFDMYLNYGQLFKLPIHIKGGGVGSLFYAGDSFIKIEPTAVHSSTAVSNTWKFVCFNATYTEIGSSNDDSIFTEIAGAVGMAGEVMNLLGINVSDIVSTISGVVNKTGISDKLTGVVNKVFGRGN